MDSNDNVTLREDFSQVCVWPATVCGTDKVEEFEKFILEELGTRAQFLEEIKTYPDVKDGRIVDDTGGRNDLFFAIHKDDVGKFAVPRFAYGIRWIEDVYGNGGGNLYPERVAGYKSWSA